MSTLTAAHPSTPFTSRRSLPRSVAAGVAGLLAIVILSTATDLVLQAAGVYPPQGQPLGATGLYLLAVVYRTGISVFGCWLAARLAPRNGMRHALALGIVGAVVSIGGVIVNVQAHLGPNWYPIALVAVALPCAWLGGAIHRARHA
jgi:hypothetical protein